MLMFPLEDTQELYLNIKIKAFSICNVPLEDTQELYLNSGLVPSGVNTSSLKKHKNCI